MVKRSDFDKMEKERDHWKWEYEVRVAENVRYRQDVKRCDWTNQDFKDRFDSCTRQSTALWEAGLSVQKDLDEANERIRTLEARIKLLKHYAPDAFLRLQIKEGEDDAT